MKSTAPFESALYGIAPRCRRILEFISDFYKLRAEEIRLRAGLPLSLTVSGEAVFVEADSRIGKTPNKNTVIVTQDELQQSLMLLCNNSVYAHENELNCGYLSMPSGNRAGIGGVFSSTGSFLSATSINIRIAREICGCADLLAKNFDGGMLIAGPPGSGKTTILRDLVRQLSSGTQGTPLRVCVIDSRGEISGGFDGQPHNDLGFNTDLLVSQNKSLGTQIALRTLFPQVIAFDEIGTAEELQSVTDCFNAGVNILTTAHCGSASEIMHRAVTVKLINSGAINKVAILQKQIGAVPQIFSIEELFCALDN